jgi:DNA-binding MurR/RpiR family transcriptional regulator
VNNRAVATFAQPSLLEQVRALLPSMYSAERKIGLEVFRDPASVVNIPVTELGEAAGASAATVVRFCRSPVLRGDQDLKLRLAGEMFASDHETTDSVSVDDSAAEIVAKVLGGAASALTDAARYVDVETLSPG